MRRILLVEDNEHIMRINSKYLSVLGYEILQADTYAGALRMLSQERVDLIVLDIMLPDGDGVELCGQIRRQSDVPILFLTAKSAGSDIVTGLRRGGDDYLTKPYELDILGARIDALLRRANATIPETGAYRVGVLCFDLVQSRATVNGEDLNLSGKEFGVLLYLCKNRQRLVSREALYQAVWGQADLDSGSILWTTISRLKKKIAPYEAQLSLDSSHEGYELYVAGGTP